MTTIATVLTALSSDSGKADIVKELGSSASIMSWCPTVLVDNAPVADNEQATLSLALTDLAFAPLTLQSVSTDSAAGTLTVALAAGTLTGKYAVTSEVQKSNTMDTGGAMETLLAVSDVATNTEDAQPTASGNANPQLPNTMTDTQFDQLQQANSQRVKLNKTSNGRELVARASKYNDNYNNAFMCSASLRNIWQRYDSVNQMMAHTSSALTAGDNADSHLLASGELDPAQVINPDDQYFGTGYPEADKSNYKYNYQAFSKKLALYSTMVFSPDPSQQAAAPSVLHFQGQVNSTGNTQQTTTQMTSTSVFDAVNNPPKNDMVIDHEKVAHAIRHVGAGTHKEEHLQVLSNHNIALDEQLISDIQSIHQEMLGLKYKANAADGDALWSGDMSEATAAATYTMTLTQQPDGAITSQMTSNTLNLSALGIDTSSWDGPAAADAKSALAAASFFTNLVESRISGYVEAKLRAAINTEAGA